jgi:hypothetical protein
MMNKNVTLLVCVVSLCLTGLVACSSGGGGGGGFFGEDLTDDPLALLAAEAAGHTTAGMEIVLLGAGLLTEIPLGELPAEAVEIAEVAINELLSDCVTAELLEGSNGLSLEFASGGCGIPGTNVQLEGGFAFSTDAEEETATWGLGFDAFKVAGVEVDGALEVTIEQSEKLDYTFDELSVVSSSQDIEIDAFGNLTTNSEHTRVSFDGDSTLNLNGDTFSLEVDDLNRSFLTDCFPETGTITVDLTSEDGDDFTASIVFEDDALGLDSDDSGIVRVTIDGEDHVAELPSRNCSGF